MTVWRTALRIAAREARRARGRTVMVLLLLALPVFGLTFAAVTYDMFHLTPDEEVTRELGTADARMLWYGREPARQNVDGTSWTSDEPPADAQDKPRPTAAELLRHLPPGSRAVELADGYLELRTADGIGGMEVLGIDAGDPVARGIVEIVAGRAPTTAGEVAASAAALERLGAGVGETVQTADRKQTLTVVGQVEVPADLGEVLLRPPVAQRTEDVSGGVWLVDTPGPVTWERVRELNALGVVVRSRALLLDPPADAPGALDDSGTGLVDNTLGVAVVVGGLALLEVVLLAGPAFAIGARRRRRDLGLIAANGGTPAHLRRIVLADGVVLGLGGAVLGIVVGIAAAFAGRPLVEEYVANARAGGYRVWPLALVVVAVLAVVAGLLAAAVPAVTAARQDVVAALTGRRGQVRSRRRWVLAGAALVLGGAALAGFGALRVREMLILGGLVVAELGLVLVTPAFVGLIAAAGRSLPLGPRIALRDTARNRAAAAPAISAVMAAVAGCVAIGTFLVSDAGRQASTYVPALPDGYVALAYNLGPDEDVALPPASAVRATVAGSVALTDMRPVAAVACPAGAPADTYCGLEVTLPPERVCPYDAMELPLPPDREKAALADPRCGGVRQMDGGGTFQSVVDDGTTLPLLVRASPERLRAATAILRAGGVVVGAQQYVKDGMVTVATTAIERRTTRVPGYALPGLGMTITVYGPSVPAVLGLRTAPSGFVAATSAVPDQAAEDELRAGLADLSGGRIYPYVERGVQTENDTETIVLAVAAVLIALGATAVATGLAAAEGRRDLSTLAAVGAAPGVRRVLSLSQSGVIAGLGSVLGAAAGLAAGLAVLAAFNRQGAGSWPVPPTYPLSVPWTLLALLAAIPLIAMLGAGLFTRARLPVERRAG